MAADPEVPPPHPVTKQPAQRPKPMRVLCLGLSRTATMSLYYARKRLGYTPYHCMEMNFDVANDSLVHWHEAMEAKFHDSGKKYAGEDFDKMLWRYDATTDIPCALFAEELMAAYPDAKIILNIRDVEGWAKSIDGSFYTIVNWKRWSLLELIDLQMVRHYMPILKTTLACWTGGDWRDKSKLPEGFARHYKHVRKLAADQGREILEHRAKDGWGPLCRFLRQEVPHEPYPFFNEAGDVVRWHYTIFWARLLYSGIGWLKWIGPIAAAGTAVWWHRQRGI